MISTTKRPVALARGMAILALAIGLAMPLATPLAAERVAIGQTFVAGGLDPAVGSTGWALVTHGIAEQLFTVSKAGEVVPQLASGAERTGPTTWRISLAPDRRFADGSPVDAAAVATSLNRTSEANPAARASAGRLEFRASDAETLVVETERPTPILPSILAEWAFPVYRETAADPVFTGPFAVAGFAPGERIDLVPNEHFDGAERRPSITLTRVADPQALALGLMAGELDMAFNLPVESLGMIEARPDLTVESFPVAYQYMMWLNTRRAPLADARVRRAIDLAIDRADLAKAARAGIPATGAFAAIYPFAAERGTVADPAAAARLLDEAGWLLDGTGRRVKNGETLELTLHAYPQRPDLVTFQPVVRAALEDLGIGITTRVVETPSETARGGDFDLFLWAQHTAPAGDPAFFLSLFLESSGDNNYSGWSNAAFDAVIDALREEADPDERVFLAHEAQRLIAEEAPVAFLLTPEWHVGLSPRLADYEPWGSDYYVIRADLQVTKP